MYVVGVGVEEDGCVFLAGGPARRGSRETVGPKDARSCACSAWMRSICRSLASSTCLTETIHSLSVSVDGKLAEITSDLSSVLREAVSWRRKASSSSQSSVPKSCALSARSLLDHSQNEPSPWREVRMRELSLLRQSGSSQQDRNLSINSAKESSLNRALSTANQF